jgi:hypothetical protein
VTVSVAGQDLVKPLFDFHGSSIDIGSHSAVDERLQQQLAGYGELVFKPRQSSFFRFDRMAVQAPSPMARKGPLTWVELSRFEPLALAPQADIQHLLVVRADQFRPGRPGSAATLSSTSVRAACSIRSLSSSWYAIK